MVIWTDSIKSSLQSRKINGNYYEEYMHRQWGYIIKLYEIGCIIYWTVTRVIHTAQIAHYYQPTGFFKWITA